MSPTIEVTAVAITVTSIATTAVATITASRIGPRSDRSPTSLFVIASIQVPHGAGHSRPAEWGGAPAAARPPSRGRGAAGVAGGHARTARVRAVQADAGHEFGPEGHAPLARRVGARVLGTLGR